MPAVVEIDGIRKDPNRVLHKEQNEPVRGASGSDTTTDHSNTDSGCKKSSYHIAATNQKNGFASIFFKYLFFATYPFTCLKDYMKRRDFISNSSLAAAGLTTLLAVSCTTGSKDKKEGDKK